MSEQQTDQNETTDEAVTEAASEAMAEESTPNAEAAKYRRRLRGVETERDQALQQMVAAQTALAEQLMAGERVRPAAVWASGVTLDDLLDEGGNVDPLKVSHAANEATTKLGLRRMPKPDRSVGYGGSQAPSSWEGAFRPTGR